MTELGKCLAFWFKYPGPMKAIEEAKDIGVSELEREKLKSVAMAARCQAAAFLEACMNPMQDRFGELWQRTRGAVLEKSWNLRCEISSKDGTRSFSNPRVGVHIFTRQPNRVPRVCIVPWIGMRRAPQVVENFRTGIQGTIGRSELGSNWERRFVGLELIAVEIGKDFVVDREPLLRQVVAAFAKVPNEMIERQLQADR